MGLQSSLAFLGVLVFGAALSAGVAARFTRPVRRLDAAIHSLSAGDLHARVDVRGKDEVARLGAAFNEMARSLHAHRQREREMTRREKLSALGQLAAGVAHDVRNPLHSMALTLQHLAQAARPESEAKQQEFDESVSVIREEIGRLDELVANFLRFTRAEARQRTVVEPGQLVNETVRLVEKEAARRSVVIRTDVAKGLPDALVDAEGLRSALLNLVLNAFEAMPGGGELLLRASCDGEAFEIEVRDDGRGIEAELQEQVFDFAYTTKDGGHGLGLAMVHQVIVEDHGGEVELDSSVGEGTRIVLRLPVEADAEHGA